MTTPDLVTDDPDLALAIRIIADARLGSPSLLARHMKIPFVAAQHFLAEMERRGIVGPAHGSRARDVRVRICNRCGRLGTRGFYVRDPDWVVGNRTACRNQNACARRRALATPARPAA